MDGEAPDARFYCPHSVVQAASGELVVADCYNNAIRVVTPTGTVRTLCGNGQAGFSDGTGTDARFNRPTGLAWDSDGTLLVLLLAIFPSIHLSMDPSIYQHTHTHTHTHTNTHTHTHACMHACMPMLAYMIGGRRRQPCGAPRDDGGGGEHRGRDQGGRVCGRALRTRPLQQADVDRGGRRRRHRGGRLLVLLALLEK